MREARLTEGFGLRGFWTLAVVFGVGGRTLGVCFTRLGAIWTEIVYVRCRDCVGIE